MIEKLKNKFPYLRLIFGILIGILISYILSVYGIKNLIFKNFGKEISFIEAMQYVSYTKWIITQIIWSIIGMLPIVIAYKKNSINKNLIYWFSFFGLLINIGIINLLFIIWAAIDKPGKK